MSYLAILLKTLSRKKCPGWLQMAILKNKTKNTQNKTKHTQTHSCWCLKCGRGAECPTESDSMQRPLEMSAHFVKTFHLTRLGFKAVFPKCKNKHRYWSNFSVSVWRKLRNDVRWSLLVNLNCIFFWLLKEPGIFSLCWLAICVFYFVQYLVMHVTHFINWLLCVCVFMYLYIFVDFTDTVDPGHAAPARKRKERGKWPYNVDQYVMPTDGH